MNKKEIEAGKVVTFRGEDAMVLHIGWLMIKIQIGSTKETKWVHYDQIEPK